MGSGAKIEIEGFEEVVEFFSDIKKKFSPEVIGDIAQKGATLIKNEARRQIPIGGELGRISKKGIVIKRDRANKTIREVTIGNNLVDLHGKPVSIGKVLRHMTAGRQKMRFRKTKGNAATGRVRERGGDFIERAGQIRGKEAIERMTEAAVDIIEKRASKLRGVTVR